MMVLNYPCTPFSKFATKARLSYGGGVRRNDPFTHFADLVKNFVLPIKFSRSLSAGSVHDSKIDEIDRYSTTMEAHLKLAGDDSDDVRYALAENHNISRAVLHKLEDDSNPYVAHRATKTLERINLNDSEFLSWRMCRAS